MIFLEKKPNGYVYTDLYKKKCFDTIRDVIAGGTYFLLKREYTNPESVILVSSAYYDYVNSLITVQPYARNVIEISDDYVSENIFKLASVINDVNNLYDVYTIVNTMPYTEDVTIYPSIIKGYLINKTSFNALLTAASIPNIL